MNTNVSTNSKSVIPETEPDTCGLRVMEVYDIGKLQ